MSVSAPPGGDPVAAGLQRGDRLTVSLGPMVHGGVCIAHIDTPHVGSTHVHTPHVDMPDVDTPHVDTPDVDSTHVHTPHVDTPHVDSTHVHTPDVDSTHIDTPHVDSTHVHTPHVHTPHVDTPHVDTAQIDVKPVDSAAHGAGGPPVTVFVDGGIPGEVAEIELSYRRKKVWFARVIAVAEPSPDRVVPPCPYVGTCGGCQLQHVAYPAQLELKRDIVLDAMRRAGVPLPGTAGVRGMDDPWRYRWRGEFHVIRAGQAPADASSPPPGLGFNRVRSWRGVAVEDCLIHHPTITRSLPVLRDAVALGGAADLSVLHITAGDGGGELLLRPKPRHSLDPAVIDAVSGDLPGGITLSTEATTLHWRGHVFRAAPESFIQVNQGHLDVLYGCVIDALGDLTGRRIVDAYAGIGMMSVALAETAAEVVCVEENRTSARMGLLNARLNGVEERLRYLAEPVEDALPALLGDGSGRPVDAVVLDPPRAGCDSRVTALLALAGPRRIVYVSCDPATLARDLRVMVTSGPYRVEQFDIVDMFPQTHHVECVASLHRVPDGGAGPDRH